MAAAIEAIEVAFPMANAGRPVSWVTSRPEGKLVMMGAQKREAVCLRGTARRKTLSDASVSAIPTKILVPIDFSGSSHAAMDMAMELAEKFHAELILLHVLPESAADDVKAAVEKNFAMSQASMTAKGIKGSTKVAEDHDVAGYILEFAEEEKVDLVVLSTHGVSGWYPVVFGSVAEKIVKLIHTPLMLLRTEKPETSVKIPHGRLMEWW